MFISVVHKMIVVNRTGGGRHRHKRKPDSQCGIPLMRGLRIEQVETFDQNNNLLTTFKGHIMSIALVGKQQVIGTVVPLDSNNNPIDLTIWPIDQIIQPGSEAASSSDLTIFSASLDPSNPLSIIAQSVDGASGSAGLTYIARDINGNVVSLTDTVSVTPATTTTSTSTTTTTTEAAVAPVLAGFQLNWGTPTDIV